MASLLPTRGMGAGIGSLIAAGGMGFAGLATPSTDLLPSFSIDYTVGAAVAESHQLIYLYKPNPVAFPEPAAGYPLLLLTEFGDYITNAPASGIPISTRLEYRCLTELGIAVALMGNTGVYTDISGTRNLGSTGGGLFHPPGGTGGWEDDLRYSAPKECVLAVQKLRFGAATYGIDAARIVVAGDSTGSGAMSAPAYWPDQADASKADHRQASSRVLAAILNIGQFDWGYYKDDVAPPGNFNFFPAESGDQVFDLAATYGDARADYLEWASPLVIMANSPEQRALNGSSVPLWSFMGLAGTNGTDFTLSGEYGEDTAKRPTALNSVDPNASSPFPNYAKHEAGQIVLMARQMRGIDVNGYHRVHDRYFVDLAAASWIVANEPAVLADEILLGPLVASETSAEFVGSQLEWLGLILSGTVDPDPPTAQAGGRVRFEIAAGHPRSPLAGGRVKSELAGGTTGTLASGGI